MNLSKDEASDEDDDESLDHEPRNHGLEKNQKKKNCSLVRFPRSFFATFTQTLHCAVFLADGAVWVVSYHL